MRYKLYLRTGEVVVVSAEEARRLVRKGVVVSVHECGGSATRLAGRRSYLNGEYRTK